MVNFMLHLLPYQLIFNRASIPSTQPNQYVELGHYCAAVEFQLLAYKSKLRVANLLRPKGFVLVCLGWTRVFCRFISYIIFYFIDVYYIFWQEVDLSKHKSKIDWATTRILHS